jgi:hypothetical protein
VLLRLDLFYENRNREGERSGVPPAKEVLPELSACEVSVNVVTDSAELSFVVCP